MLFLRGDFLFVRSMVSITPQVVFVFLYGIFTLCSSLNSPFLSFPDLCIALPAMHEGKKVGTKEQDLNLRNLHFSSKATDPVK